MIDVIKVIKSLSDKIGKRFNQIESFYKDLSSDIKTISTSLKDFSKKDELTNISNKINTIKKDTQETEQSIKNELSEHYKNITKLINEKLSTLSIDYKSVEMPDDIDKIIEKHILAIQEKNIKTENIITIDYASIYKKISDKIDESLLIHKKENNTKDIDIDEIVKKVLENIEEPIGIKDIKEKNGKITITLTNGKTKTFTLPKSQTFIANTGGQNTDTSFAANKKISEIEGMYKEAYSENFVEYVYDNGNITNINIYNNQAKNIELFTKVIGYNNENIESVVITDKTNGYEILTTYSYDSSGNISSKTKTLNGIN